MIIHATHLLSGAQNPRPECEKSLWAFLFMGLLKEVVWLLNQIEKQGGLIFL